VRDERESAADSERSHALAIKALREKLVRSGQIQPRPGDATEARWLKEGPRPFNELEAVQ
jgi:hypothetical protein